MGVLAARRACASGFVIASAALLTAAASALAQKVPDREDTLVLANHILAMEGLVGPYGHVSVRVGPDRFMVATHRSPEAVERGDLKEVPVAVARDDVKRQDLYSEIFIHSQIYRLLPAVGAVVHTHAPYGVALSTLSLSEPIRPTTNPGANLGEVIPVYGTVGLIETPEVAERMAKTLQGQNAVLLRGHGAVVIGRTVEQAVLRAIYLEIEARAQLSARPAGTPLFYTREESAIFSRTTAGEHAWSYYVGKLRRLERTDR